MTEHQKQVYEGVVYENLSLGEIASEQGISRQGVHDIVKRCDKALQEYEDKLPSCQIYENTEANSGN